MMVKMLPKMKKLVFAADGLYMNRRLEQQIKKHLNAHYPHLEYERLTASEAHKKQLREYLLSGNDSYGLLFPGITSGKTFWAEIR